MRSFNHAIIAFAVCCVLIATISVHDAMLLVVNHDVIQQEEHNPLGQWLLSLQGGEVWLFVVVKLLGTSVVCATLITLFNYRQRIAMLTAGVLACFQIGLLAYLSFG